MNCLCDKMVSITLVLLAFSAFIVEIIDVVLGMGFGTIMTPLLITVGYSPLVVLPIILLLQAIAGIAAGFSHHFHENIDLLDKKRLKIVLVFVISGIIGAVGGAFLATHLKLIYVDLAIGVIVILAGIALLVRKILSPGKFSIRNLVLVGLLGAFGKTLTGVFGPIVTSGQILSGVKEKPAVAITVFSEGITSLVGFFVFYYFVGINWDLFLLFLIPVLIAIPLSTYIVKKAPKQRLQKGIGILAIILGILLILKVL